MWMVRRLSSCFKRKEIDWCSNRARSRGVVWRNGADRTKSEESIQRFWPIHLRNNQTIECSPMYRVALLLVKSTPNYCPKCLSSASARDTWEGPQSTALVVVGVLSERPQHMCRTLLLKAQTVHFPLELSRVFIMNNHLIIHYLNHSWNNHLVGD